MKLFLKVVLITIIGLSFPVISSHYLGLNWERALYMIFPSGLTICIISILVVWAIEGQKVEI